jgi:hypothetical protein
MSDIITIPVTFEKIKECKPNKFNIGDKVKVSGFGTLSGVVVGLRDGGWYTVQLETGSTGSFISDSLTKFEKRGCINE